MRKPTDQSPEDMPGNNDRKRYPPEAYSMTGSNVTAKYYMTPKMVLRYGDEKHYSRMKLDGLYRYVEQEIREFLESRIS